MTREPSTMTVKDLIDKLKEFPEDATVEIDEGHRHGEPYVDYSKESNVVYL